MMFKQFIEMGLEPVEAMRLERAVERFSAAEKVEKSHYTKKVIKKAEVEGEEKFNSILFALEAASVVIMLALLYGLYFTLPAWVII